MSKFARTLCYLYAIGLMLQGGFTLLARLVPAVDHAIPALLETTGMIVPHSLLHIASSLLAFAAARRGTETAAWFLLAFGLFYTLLGLAGTTTGQQFGLGLQPFDNPFHLVIGGIALVTGLVYRLRR